MKYERDMNDCFYLFQRLRQNEAQNGRCDYVYQVDSHQPPRLLQRSRHFHQAERIFMAPILSRYIFSIHGDGALIWYKDLVLMLALSSQG